LQVVWKHF